MELPIMHIYNRQLDSTLMENSRVLKIEISKNGEVRVFCLLMKSTEEIIPIIKGRKKR